LTAEKRDFTEGGYFSGSAGHPGTYLQGANLIPDPACENAENSFILRRPNPMPGGAERQLCALDYRKYQFLIGNLERANVFGSAEYDVTGHTTMFAEILASRMRADGAATPSQQITPPFPTVPANHVDNPFGSAVGFLGRPLGSASAADDQRNSTADDSMRVVVGIEGDLEGAAEDTVFESWEWELFAMMGVSRFRSTFRDNLREEFQEALDSCDDPSDLSHCFNPFYSAIDGTGTPNSQEVLDRFMSQMDVENTHALQSYNAGMSGSLFELPGGDLGIAFGGEIRHERRKSELDHEANTDQFAFYIGNNDASASRDTFGGYLELRWPFYDGIELQTAARIERYTDTDATPISPFVGLTLTPAEIAGRDNVAPAFRKLQLRGNVASAFRAPNVYQSYPAKITIPTPVSIEGQTQVLAARIAGNPNLDPETALAFSVGVAWAPVDMVNLTLDLWHYNYVDRIDRENAQQVVDRWRESGMPPDPRVVTETNIDGSQRIQRLEINQINVPGDTITNGIDFGLMLSLDGADFDGEEDDWKLSFGGQGTYTHTYDIPFNQAAPRGLPQVAGMDQVLLPPADCEGSGATDLCHVVGNRNNNNYAPPLPRLKINFPVIFAASGHSVGAVGHFVSEMEDDVEPNADGSFDVMAAQFTLDLQYGYTLEDVVGEELTIRVGSYNVFDTYPPHANGASTPYEAGVYDPRGRMFYAKLSSTF
jgi:iron complex outermembrane recepter protein